MEIGSWLAFIRRLHRRSLCKCVPIPDHAIMLGGLAGYDLLDTSFPANLTNRFAVAALPTVGRSARTKILIEFDHRSDGAVFTFPPDSNQRPTFEVKILEAARRTRGALPGPGRKCRTLNRAGVRANLLVRARTRLIARRMASKYATEGTEVESNRCIPVTPKEFAGCLVQNCLVESPRDRDRFSVELARHRRCSALGFKAEEKWVFWESSG